MWAPYAAMRRAWQRADRLGADTIFTWDHPLPIVGPARGGSHDGWTVLAGMAATTERAELGVLVSAVGYRNPALLADMARTVDQIAGGRVILGLGAGWHRPDYRMLNLAFPPAAERLRQLGAALPLVRARLERLNPPPVRQPLPILIGGNGPRVTMRLAAEHATIWSGFGDPVAARHLNSRLDDWCRRLNRDPATLERSIMLQAWQIGLAPAYLRAGITHLLMASSGPVYSLGAFADLVAWRDSCRAGQPLARNVAGRLAASRLVCRVERLAAGPIAWLRQLVINRA